MQKTLGQNASLTIRNRARAKTMAPFVMFGLPFSWTVLPGLCIVLVSGGWRRAAGLCPQLWQNPSSEPWQTMVVLLPLPISASSLPLTALVGWDKTMIFHFNLLLNHCKENITEIWIEMSTLSTLHVLSSACVHPVWLVCCFPFSTESCAELNCKTLRGVRSSLTVLFTKIGTHSNTTDITQVENQPLRKVWL